jgi:hypothetical protein
MRREGGGPSHQAGCVREKQTVIRGRGKARAKDMSVGRFGEEKQGSAAPGDLGNGGKRRGCVDARIGERGLRSGLRGMGRGKRARLLGLGGGSRAGQLGTRGQRLGRADLAAGRDAGTLGRARWAGHTGWAARDRRARGKRERAAR